MKRRKRRRKGNSLTRKIETRIAELKHALKIIKRNI